MKFAFRLKLDRKKGLFLSLFIDKSSQGWKHMSPWMSKHYSPLTPIQSNVPGKHLKIL